MWLDEGERGQSNAGPCPCELRVSDSGLSLDSVRSGSSSGSRRRTSKDVSSCHPILHQKGAAIPAKRSRSTQQAKRRRIATFQISTGPDQSHTRPTLSTAPRLLHEQPASLSASLYASLFHPSFFIFFVLSSFSLPHLFPINSPVILHPPRRTQRTRNRAPPSQRSPSSFIQGIFY